MPFARVGAMPQPAPSKSKQDKRKGSSTFHPLSKPKGITIEVSHNRVWKRTDLPLLGLLTRQNPPFGIYMFIQG
jgi:hypothetical protein